MVVTTLELSEYRTSMLDKGSGGRAWKGVQLIDEQGKPHEYKGSASRGDSIIHLKL